MNDETTEIAGIPVVVDPTLPPGTFQVRQLTPRKLIAEFLSPRDARLFASLKRDAGEFVEVRPSRNPEMLVAVYAATT